MLKKVPTIGLVMGLMTIYFCSETLQQTFPLVTDAEAKSHRSSSRRSSTKYYSPRHSSHHNSYDNEPYERPITSTPNYIKPVMPKTSTVQTSATNTTSTKTATAPNTTSTQVATPNTTATQTSATNTTNKTVAPNPTTTQTTANNPTANPQPSTGSSILRAVGTALTTATVVNLVNNALAKDHNTDRNDVVGGADAPANAEEKQQSQGYMQNFSEAKKQLRVMYRDKAPKEEQKTFYCNCPITFTSKTKMQPDLKACGYTPYKQEERANTINWEHIMPASWLGKQLQCWQKTETSKGGRQACQQDPEFTKREGDMHNLVPAIGEINGDRSNYPYNQFMHDTQSNYGSCQFFVSSSKPRAVEPAPYTRGFIARAMLYMSKQYNIRLSDSDQMLMTIWNKQYPPTAWECDRNQLIASIQGNDNIFITEACIQPLNNTETDAE